jgi:hypothetical protein
VPTATELARAVEALFKGEIEPQLVPFDTLGEGGVPRKYVSDVLDGIGRPEALKAWRIGQALQHCGAACWTGIAMLYAAGHYADYVGVSVIFAGQCRSDAVASPAYDTAVEYIKTVPMLFGSFLAKERFVNASDSSGTDADDQAALSEFDDRALLARRSSVVELDAARLQRAWIHWDVCRDTQFPLAIRARSIALSKDLRIALREREAETYLTGVLSDPNGVEREMSARL